uniref:Swap surp domain-containing protein d111 g-patch domain-containing protein isoform 1 n=1 Tax=Tetraselmis sp. GSL018 TaxID=582737 RepID=A0A061R2E6_9CHLO
MSGSNNGISFSLGGTTSSNAAPGRGRGMQGGKLAFGFSGNRGPGAKRLATPAAAVFETPGSDDEEDIPASNDKRRRVNEGVSSTQEPTASSAGPQPPSDPNVLKVADKLAAFVAKNGDSFEGVTKERNPGDTPFRFLFDKSCNDYMWYRMKVKEYRGEASEPAASSQQPLPGPNSQSPTGGQKDASGEAVNTLRGAQETEEARRAQEAISKGDSLAAMNAYMKLAAKHEEKRGPVKDTREMPPPDTLVRFANGPRPPPSPLLFPSQLLLRFLLRLLSMPAPFSRTRHPRSLPCLSLLPSLDARLCSPHPAACTAYAP